MARKYPRFLYSNPTNTKSEGPFCVHLLEPRMICKVITTPGMGMNIEVLEVFDTPTTKELDDTLEAMGSFLIHNS